MVMINMRTIKMGGTYESNWVLELMRNNSIRLNEEINR